MAAEVIELIGGPCDGKTVIVPEDEMTYWVYQNTTDFSRLPLPSDKIYPTVLEGLYSRPADETKKNKFEWRGWRSFAI